LVRPVSGSPDAVVGGADVTPKAQSQPALLPIASPAPLKGLDLALLVGFWLLVAVPMAWGLFVTVRQAWALVG
jgi:hypothetical protein